MKTKWIISIIVLTILAAFVFALPPNKGIETAKEKSHAIDEGGNIVAPPPFVTPFPLQPLESELTKVVFIRYAPGFGKVKPCDNDGICDSDEGGWCSDCKGEEPTINPCYAFLSGAKPKWNWVEDYYYNDLGLGMSSSSAVSTWESATLGDIFRQGLQGNYDWGVYDYVNSISYGDYNDIGMCQTADPCVIGVTALWYRGKNIYEYDIMYDTDFFPGSIDLNSVVLHEMGHAAGLDDLYDGTCIEEVMYGYYEGIKLVLGQGDILGIKTLYG